MAKKTGELKKRCLLAKQRLKMGYWEAAAHGAEAEDTAVSSRAERRVQTSSAVRVDRVSAAEEKMYKKVCAILDGDEVAINPIGQLIERDIYDGLDADGRQRYVLELSEKFRELRERYYRERAGA